MLNQIVAKKKNEWLSSPDCSISFLLDYIRKTGYLRETQIEAIATYLFLKIQGDNKPLWQLFSEGFFINGADLSKANVNEKARDFLTSNTAARALYEFSRLKVEGKTFLPLLEQLIINRIEELDYKKIIKRIFYDVNYSDYLFSLPMGAGKTFLMAAFMYLDLYFATLEPGNKHFAHNFLVLVPSGLKSSIIPSLRTIENFDPTWILPEPAASNLKRNLRFEILDESKSAKKSNKARNPNAQKVNQYLAEPDLSGLVLVVNAEKIILDRLELSNQLELIENDNDDKDRLANELRNLIGKIPNLEILIDEVHHAASDDIKLRQVVNRWNERGNVTTVLGFSGTPYLSKAEAVDLAEDASLRLSQITNTVYYYPLLAGIKSFLKKPTVKIAENVESLEIIRRGVEDFYRLYKDKVYDNGSIAKLAIYCGKIERLETEVYPLVASLITKYGDSEANILKFHKGNSAFKLPRENELEFRSLDQPFSQKRIILLVQVGKEGWDCRSLTGVILSNKGDSPTTMVLQTSCRCLRQVDKDKDETALIWLNQFNADKLNDQLADEQHTSIEEINRAGKEKDYEVVDRISRVEYLELPLIEFYQLGIKYNMIEEEKGENTPTKLETLHRNIEKYKVTSVIREKKNLNEEIEGGTLVITETGSIKTNFDLWLADIVKESFYTLTYDKLLSHTPVLLRIFAAITYPYDGGLAFNDSFDRGIINSRIRLAFSIKRKLQTTEETIHRNAQLLIAENLGPSKANEKMYPPFKEVKQILEMDNQSGRLIEMPGGIDDRKVQEAYKKLLLTFKEMHIEASAPDLGEFRKQFDLPLSVMSKNRSFHYIPYNFWQSNFEKEMLIETLQLREFIEYNLEIYYNGERGLTEFVIKCFAKEGKYWHNIGNYTPDLLIVQRKENVLHKLLILETKGKGFSSDPAFKRKKNYVETDFLKTNNDKFGYQRFDFLYLQDDEKQANQLSKLKMKFKEFFA